MADVGSCMRKLTKDAVGEGRARQALIQHAPSDGDFYSSYPLSASSLAAALQAGRQCGNMHFQAGPGQWFLNSGVIRISWELV